MIHNRRRFYGFNKTACVRLNFLKCLWAIWENIKVHGSRYVIINDILVFKPFRDTYAKKILFKQFSPYVRLCSFQFLSI